MSIAGLLISLLLAAIAIAIVARPLLRSRRGGQQENASRQQQREQLRTYYERVLTNIRDLDEDFSTGKLSGADHQQEREVWLQRGIILLRALDELDKEQRPPSSASEADSIDRAIEAAVAAYRETANQSAPNSGRG